MYIIEKQMIKYIVIHYALNFISMYKVQTIL